ncbi:F-type H+-transporting ATPase subunit b [Desulfocicer vacuolatum DSM 3385]|uniref:ATP synthase subunit b n=1 Tax=Desulfocicer vacuolatum DSM 3385 TaxID=1121400 RepID=A0A1W1YZE6_9BACT|nr:ATP synthase F0 subunit B [Desulfocicer vacuolatum]SMC41570.1 F-type H+-transporting ATPase subunit b [Desulfocicer vacuolatum DSM 3385]
MKIVRFMRKHSKTIIPAAWTFLFVFAGIAMASSGGDHGAAAPKGWVVTDTYKVMNFAVLMIALFFIARKPVAEFFSSRVTAIKDELAELEQKKAAAEKSLAEYAEKMATLDQETQRIVETYVKQGEVAKQRILAEAEAQAAKLEESAKRNIEQEFKAAKLSLQQEIAEKALEQAETLVKELINSEDQDRLVDEYLDKVVA